MEVEKTETREVKFGGGKESTAIKIRMELREKEGYQRQ